MDYDQLAEAYGRNRAIHPDVLAALIERGHAGEGSRVLEIGCGTGNYISAIAAETGATCTGIDPSAEMLRRARANPALPKNRTPDLPEVTFIHARAENVPLADRQFDLVYSVDVIHHIEDREAAAREAYRLLKPGGALMVVTESEDDLRNRTPHVTYFPDIVDVELARYPSIETIEHELVAAGLEIGAEIAVSRPRQVEEITAYRDKAYSSLHLISDEAFASGLARMADDLERGAIPGDSRYTIVVGRRPISGK
jgi:SAM-dependent methyltransferase